MVSTSLPLKKTSNRYVSLLKTLYYFFEGFLLVFVPESWKQKNVSGQTVLITGAGSGIGQLMAIRFAKLGCKVIVWDVNSEGMEKTVQLFKDEKLDTNKLHCYKINLADRDSIYETANRVKKEIGIVDILINNAGVVSGKYFLDLPDDKIKLTFDVNTLSHFYTVKSFLPDMIKRNQGHIVTVASVAGNVAGCALSDYHASKFANVGFDLSLRMELAQAGLNNIKTSIVKPYFISTGMFSGVNTDLMDFLKPEYVADKVLSGILANTVEIIIPYWFYTFFWLGNLASSKCIVPVGDFLGGYDFMSHFQGRQAPVATGNKATTTSGNEINNNNAFNKSKNEDATSNQTNGFVAKKTE